MKSTRPVGQYAIQRTVANKVLYLRPGFLTNPRFQLIWQSLKYLLTGNSFSHHTNIFIQTHKTTEATFTCHRPVELLFHLTKKKISSSKQSDWRSWTKAVKTLFEKKPIPLNAWVCQSPIIFTFRLPLSLSAVRNWKLKRESAGFDYRKKEDFSVTEGRR